MSIRDKLAIAATLLALGTIAHAQTAESLPAEQMDEYRQLMGLLEAETTIATKTRLNADYVPGIVSVLHGDELEASGARTVWQALARVPGIELSIEESGRKQIVVRGLGRTYASGNVKLMLNGVALNSANTAQASPLLNIPIEQVERIEVIRGPGSAVHGEFAYTGVVNVITRSDKRSLFVRAGTDNHRGGGGLYSYRDSDSDLAVDLSVGHWSEDDGGVEVDADILHGTTLEPYSNAPGPTNEAQRDTTALLSIQRSGYRLNLQWLEDGFGDYYGINEELPPDEQRIVTRNRYQGLELGKNHALSTEVNVDFHAAMLRTEEEKRRLFIGNSAPATDDLPPYVMNGEYVEQRLSAGVDLDWQPNAQHRLLLGLATAQIETRASTGEWGLDGGAMASFDPIVADDTRRRINSLTLQDEYRSSERLSFTAGLRHDDYSDVGNSTTPRLAAVYRLHRHHTIKAQYARAFRPPTFYELGGAVDDIDPATISTYETGYIYNDGESAFRLTLFHSELKDPITFVSGAETGYVNGSNTTLYGSEVEWAEHFGAYATLSGNISWLQSESGEDESEPLSGSSDWLGNLSLDIKPSAQTRVNLHYRYVGEVHRETEDPRTDLDSYSTLDLTLSLLHRHKQGYNLRLGLKNALDEEVVYPAPAGTYPDDRPRPGRLWWAGMSYHF